jgi:hypothetical protein
LPARHIETLEEKRNGKKGEYERRPDGVADRQAFCKTQPSLFPEERHGTLYEEITGPGYHFFYEE